MVERLHHTQEVTGSNPVSSKSIDCIMKYLILAIINLLYGVLLFFSLSAETPGFMIVLVVATVLVIFGVWGTYLWIKLTVESHQDSIPQTEPIESWWKMIRAFDLILVIGLFSRFFVIQPFVVDGPSMEPAFHDKEAILVDKISWRLRSPERGEVVIFEAPPQPTDDYIKRIIGLPGETIRIEQTKVYINNQLLPETYLTSGYGLSADEVYEKTLSSNEYFVMGDNRPHSSDSRDWGPVPKENLVGRAAVVVYPLNDFKFVHLSKLSI